MKIDDEEVLEKIQQHRIIIINGTTEGYKRMRKLLVKCLGMRRIIDTRGHNRHEYYLESNLNETYMLFDIKNFERLEMILDIFKHKRNPVIIDSFTDVQSMIKQKFIKTREKVGEHKYRAFDADWNVYKLVLRGVFERLKNHKKKIILFADLEDGKPQIDNIFLCESDLIIQATDEDNLLIKED